MMFFLTFLAVFGIFLTGLLIAGTILSLSDLRYPRRTTPPMSPEDVQRLYTEYMQPTVSRSPFRGVIGREDLRHGT